MEVKLDAPGAYPADAHTCTHDVQVPTHINTREPAESGTLLRLTARAASGVAGACLLQVGTRDANRELTATIFNRHGYVQRAVLSDRDVELRYLIPVQRAGPPERPPYFGALANHQYHIAYAITVTLWEGRGRSIACGRTWSVWKFCT